MNTCGILDAELIVIDQHTIPPNDDKENFALYWHTDLASEGHEDAFTIFTYPEYSSTLQGGALEVLEPNTFTQLSGQATLGKLWISGDPEPINYRHFDIVPDLVVVMSEDRAHRVTGVGRRITNRLEFNSPSVKNTVSNINSCFIC